MALTDSAIIWLALLVGNYMVFMHKPNWTKNLIGGLLTIFFGYLGYTFLTTDDWWGAMIMMVGTIYVVFKIGELYTGESGLKQ